MAASARMLAVAASALGALFFGGVLAGCTPSAPKPTHSATASHTPMFASDEEALKAATDAYAAYLKMSDTIAHDGGKNPERIKPYVTAAQLQKQLVGFESLLKNGLHSHGMSTFDSARLERYDSIGTDSVSMYLCNDVSRVQVLDRANRDVTPTDRTDRLPFEVAMVIDSTQKRLVLDRSEKWSGDNFC